jgi:hypothetical protein
VLAAVGLSELLGARQAEVAREVDGPDVRGQARRDLQSLPVRQREEDAVEVV